MTNESISKQDLLHKSFHCILLLLLIYIVFLYISCCMGFHYEHQYMYFSNYCSLVDGEDLSYTSLVYTGHLLQLSNPGHGRTSDKETRLLGPHRHSS